ncbi:MAG: carbohydrate-binding protein [Bacteroidales bacterium]|jgi:hypothetical protein
MKKILSLFLLGFLLTTLHAQRGRVQIQNGTVVTDMGTLLRGATDLSPYEGFVWEDIKEDLKGIKELGLNSLHLYAESADVFEPGERVAYIDSIVKWTREDSLYLVMTVTWHVNTGTQEDQVWVPDIDFIREFWQFYAPRYKDETHMVYEICNEPTWPSILLDSLTLTMERSIYDTIRKYAPETHIMFFSLANPHNVDTIFLNIHDLGDDIDWGNASVAAHGYGPSSEEMRRYLTTIQDSGYAIIMTEPGSILNKYLYMGLTRVLEQESVSYLNFISLEEINHTTSVYKGRIESSELRWTPDFGNWPGSLTSVNYRSPYAYWGAAHYDEGDIFSTNILVNTIIDWIKDDSYIAFYDLDFEEGPASFYAECSSELDGGNIEVHLDSLNGPLVATCPIGMSGDWDDFDTYSCNITTSFSGIHHVYLIFKDAGGSGLFNVRRIYFRKEAVALPETKTAFQPVHIYPNPARDYIKIKSAKPVHLEIYSMQGQLQIKKKTSSNDDLIRVNNLPSGIYVIKASDEAEIYSALLIIEDR